MSLLSLQKAMAGRELTQAEVLDATRRELEMTQDMYDRYGTGLGLIRFYYS